MQQKKQIRAWEVYDYLGQNGQNLLSALSYDHIPDDHNPVWMALAGLNPLDEEEIGYLIEIGELTEQIAERLRTMTEEGKELAAKLRPLLWSKSGKPEKGTIMTTYLVCQTIALNNIAGPIGTGDLGTIRQRWYASKSPRAMGFKFAALALEQALIETADIVLVDSETDMAKAERKGAQRVEFKVNFKAAQKKALEKELGRKPKIHLWPRAQWGRAYAQLQSGILAGMVHDRIVDYEESWVEDLSRKTSVFSPLYPELYAVLALEKEGLKPHFEPYARAAGIPMLVAMSGNCSFASVEAILRQNFRDWQGKYKPTRKNPLHLMVISDHDYAGHVPVMQGVMTQFERYLDDAVVLHRVGVTHEQLKALERSIIEAGYAFEADHNKAYALWAYEAGIWLSREPAPDISDYALDDGEYDYLQWVQDRLARGDTCYGIEVEALVPEDYVTVICDVLIEAAGGDDELKKILARLAEPNWWDAKARIQRELYNLSTVWTLLSNLEEWAERRRREVEDRIDDWSGQLFGDEYRSDSWRMMPEILDALKDIVEEQKDSIKIEDFAEHVRAKNWQPWRPVSEGPATSAVVRLWGEDFGRVSTERLVPETDDEFADLRDALHGARDDYLDFED